MLWHKRLYDDAATDEGQSEVQETPSLAVAVLGSDSSEHGLALDLGELMDTQIYRYEAKGIQAYVLATSRLREIKGGSAIVEGLSSLLALALEKQARGGTVLYSAAGGATVSFPSEEAARDFRAHWPLLVSRHAPGLQVIQAIAPNGAEAFEQIQTALRAERNLVSADLPEAGPLTLRAPRTGLPAMRVAATREGGRETLFDRATDARAKAEQNLRRAEGSRDPLGDRIWAGADRSAWPANAPFLSSVDELEDSFVAVIHIDGNDLGLRVRALSEKADRLQALTKFSVDLSAATEAAVQIALLEVGKQMALATGGNLPKIFPVRPIIVGGDDLTLIASGPLGLEIASTYLRCFEVETERRLGERLFACAGVAFVHKHYPFHLALSLAESLCKYAKTANRGTLPNGGTPSALAFHRVTESLAGSFDELLEGELRADGGRLLSMGSYLLHPLGSAPTLAGLAGLCAAIEDLPRSAVRDTISAMRLDVDSAKDRIERVREVMTDVVLGRGRKPHWTSFQNALGALGCDRYGWQSLPRGATGTPLLDAYVWNLMVAEREESQTQEAR